MQETLSRKLIVVLHADVVDSTALVRVDESVAHERIQGAFQRLSKTIESYGGTTHELRGDALVAEFGRASDAVSAALAFQAGNAEFNAGLGDDIRPELRMGISLGEVVIADNTLTGEGVVLAQRLEQLAEPGGVCIQGAAYETVPKRLPFDCKSLGAQSLKGFEEPVRAFWIALKAGEDIPAPESMGQSDRAALELPDRPSIAVLPFTNLSGDPEQEYFSDGITEDVITALSYWRWFPVIARNSTQAFRADSGDIAAVGKHLGARYLVQGSVRRAGDAVRVSVHLVDASNGHEVWSERYDRRMEDVFELQDEITERIVSGIEPQLHRAEEKRAVRKRPTDLTAWDHILRASRAKAIGGHGYGSSEGNEEARFHLLKARELEPTSAEVLAGLAQCEWHDGISGWTTDREGAFSRTVDYARQAVAQDDANYLAYAMLGIALLFGRNKTEAAIRELRTSVNLNPSAANARHGLGCGLVFAGEPAEALPHLNMVFKLDPRYRNGAAALGDLGLGNFLLGNLDESIRCLLEAATTQPDYVRSRQRLVASLQAAGRTDEARAELEKLKAIQPSLSLDYIHTTYPFEKDAHRERFANALRDAGLE